jgi:hypothetical protein
LKTRKEQGKNREKAEKHIAKCYKKKKTENLTKPNISDADNERETRGKTKKEQ